MTGDNNTIIKSIVDEIDKIINNDKEKYAQDSFASVKNTAGKVVDMYGEIENDLKNFQQFKKAQSLNRKIERANGKEAEKLQSRFNNIKYQTLEENQIEILYNNFLYFNKLLVYFQGTMLKVLGKKMKIAIVDDTGEIYEYEEEVFLRNFKEFFNIDIASKTHNLQLRFKTAKINGQSQKILEEKHQENIQATYNEVQRRASVFKAQLTKNISKILILWKENSQWDGVWASSMGDIHEAYLNFSYQKFKSFTSPPGHEDVKAFMCKGVMKVDSTSGRLQGDFQEDDSNEVAAKSIGASLMGIRQFITMAKKIKDYNNFSELKGFLETTKTSDKTKGQAKKHGEFVQNVINKKIEKVPEIIQDILTF